jgi:hypothetical protein
MENKSAVMHKFNDKTNNAYIIKFMIAAIVVIALGTGSGYVLAKLNPNIIQEKAAPSPQDENAVEIGKTYGSNDTSTFKDSTEGTLKEGGIEGEGQYHLVRPGGESQNVYLTSSLVDLSLFIDREIKVWGQTQAAQKAGWLMDVGRVEVLE